MPAGSDRSLLEDYLDHEWTPEFLPAGFRSEGYALGEAAAGSIEVVVLLGDARPRAEDLRRVWRDRSNRRATPVLVLAAYREAGQGRADVVGPHDDRSLQRGLDPEYVDRVAANALDATTAAEAQRLLASLVHTVSEVVPGLRNEGLFAGYELEEHVPQRADWTAQTTRSLSLREHTGVDLLSGLGWRPRPRGSTGYLLVDDGETRAVAVLLEGDEVFDRPGQRFGASSPVEHGLALAVAEKVPWVVAVQGDVARLYAVDPDVGVGRRGATATFTEVRVRSLDEQRLGYLTLLLSPEALRAGGSVAQILQGSADHATGLGARLRERVYADVVPGLAQTVAERTRATSQQQLDEAYHVTLVVLFRLLFVAYAEEQGLLPYRSNTVYTRRALKTQARAYSDSIATTTDGPTFSASSSELWRDLLELWRAVSEGDEEWGVPEYGGGLFDSSDARGAAIARLRLTDAEIGPALVALLVDSGRDGTRGPVDFGALSVREFGTIYEGLLESSLSLASTDLSLDARGTYVPATGSAAVVVPTGQVYFHNASGARKSTGSYFTKPFAVEHLLRSALDPAIDDHLGRVRELVDAGQDATAARAFFDFRVADIAMGSGHFLVGAVDHIALRFGAFLTDHPIPAVGQELFRLREAALAQLDRFRITDVPELDQATLLRRQVARRCIYGVDVNRIAVDLARLAVWVHTFVPGLPMSSLDHGLRQGNSLIGIATLDEAREALNPPDRGRGRRSAGEHQVAIGEDEMLVALRRARDVLARVSVTAEADAAQVRAAAEAHADAERLAEPAEALLDAAMAGRLGLLDVRDVGLGEDGPELLMAAGRRPAVAEHLRALGVLHFPVAFPEVFLRENDGFDVVLGNPPWEKVHIEAHQWWGLRFPGLRSRGAAEMTAEISRLRVTRPDLAAEFDTERDRTDAVRVVLAAGPFPGIGAGHVDLYKAFCWRDWALLRDGGRAGIVLPRASLTGTGTRPWRAAVLDHGSLADVCILVNSRSWVFDEVHQQYTIVLTTIQRGASPSIAFTAPLHSAADYERGREERVSVSAADFAAWGDGLVVPLLPNGRSSVTFGRLRRSPRLDARRSARFRPVQGDLNATANRDLWVPEDSTSADLQVLAGASFNLWQPDFGSHAFAWAERRVVEAHLMSKRARQVRTSSSAFYGLQSGTAVDLPMRKARIALRDIARSTDTRTVLAALVPPGVALVHNAPYLLRTGGEAADEALLLGVMSSVPFDWYARRYVEMHVTFDLLMPMPVPEPDDGDPLRERGIEISGRLAAVDERYAEWAAEVGVPVGSVSAPAEKQELIHELDAVVAHLYKLDRDDVVHIFETFHRGWDFTPRLTSVLVHFDRWGDR